jgi:hypothetical protein
MVVYDQGHAGERLAWVGARAKQIMAEAFSLAVRHVTFRAALVHQMDAASHRTICLGTATVATGFRVWLCGTMVPSAYTQ